MMNPFGGYGVGAGFMGLGLTLFVALLVWSIFWKGLGLWHAARRGHYWWFILILFFNTLGILEIIYLFAVLKIKRDDLFVGAPQHTEAGSKQDEKREERNSE